MFNTSSIRNKGFVLAKVMFGSVQQSTYGEYDRYIGIITSYIVNIYPPSTI